MRSLTLGAALALALATPSCLGPNRALSSLSTWNAQLSTQDWINEVVFLGLIVVPVYPVAFAADILVFNTMDYWQGENPINDPGPFPDTFHYAPAPRDEATGPQPAARDETADPPEAPEADTPDEGGAPSESE